MNYYMLRIKFGRDGDDNPKTIRRFISSRQLIGIGAPDETRGSVRFEQLKKGELVVVLSQSMPVAFVEILDDNVAPYTDDNKFPGFEWLEWVRKVKIVSWYEDDKQRLSLPSFSPTSWGPGTFKLVESNEHLIKQWHEIIMNELYKKQHEALVSEVRDLVLHEQNVVLTGAPGTGKTYLAKQIASQMIFGGTYTQEEIGKDEKLKIQFNNQYEFVQFHPSYDYTDFVEGLRPLPPNEDGNIGFQLEDGIFKKFCKRALATEEIKDNFEDVFSQFQNDCEENELFLETTKQHKKFIVEINSLSSCVAIPQTGHNTRICIKKEWLADYLRYNKIAAWKPYLTSVGNYIRDTYDYKKESQKIFSKNKRQFVFIIDEINRGDIAKIFGELFFALDPGYRGTKGRVKTQYTNLIDKDDIFKDGFYIPENVYIIGTMNDIDRNVESMDFAIRRRFTWMEIEPDKNLGMWDDPEHGITEYKSDATRYMAKINEAISHIAGLGKAYQLGASYFLKLREYKGDFGKLWKYHIQPLLNEYLRGLPNAETAMNKLIQVWNNVQTPAGQPEAEPSEGNTQA